MKIEAQQFAAGIGNNLLRALRKEDWDILEPLLEEWSATTGAVLHEPGDTVRFAYFPRGSSLISYFVVLSDGRAVETALIGREGAAGGIVSQGRLPAFTRAEVQVGGPFYRIELNSLEDAKNRSPTLRHLFARYADCLMAQIFQAVACNAVHSLDRGEPFPGCPQGRLSGRHLKTPVPCSPAPQKNSLRPPAPHAAAVMP